MGALARTFLIVMAATLVTPTLAHADGEDESGELVRREVPDLDGRPPSDENEVLDALLWIPRIITSPLYVFTEYVIRAPLGWLLTTLEENGIFDSLFASGGDFGILPTAFFELGLSPNFGVFSFLDHWPFRANRISVHAATFGEDWLRLIVRDRVHVIRDMDLDFRVELVRRPDQLVESLGFDASNAPTPRGRFGQESIEARIELSYSFWRRSKLQYRVGYASLAFSDRPWGGNPSVGGRGAGPTLIGFDTGYERAYFGADLLLDTHDPESELTGSRVRLRLTVEQNIAFGGLAEANTDIFFSSWVRWGGEVAASTDALGRGRVVMLRFRTDLVSPLDDSGLIPFFELPDVGGKGPLPGFVTGQLRGQSWLGLTFEYVWPVFALLDGSLHVSVANAFGTHYEGFDWENLRLSWGVGIVPRFSGEHLVEVSFDVGTETFARGTEITQARVVVGARHGL